MIKFLKKYEHWLAATLIVIIVFLFNLGFFTALVQPDFNNFTGAIGIAKGDKTVYISMIEQIRQGGVLNDNLFTSEVQTYKIFHPLWFVLGSVARVFDISSQAIFHIAKFISGLILLGFIYLISRKFLDLQYRLLLLFGLGFFGGIGRLVMIFYNMQFFNGDLFFKLLPADIWFSEGFSFLTLYHSPLFIISQLLMIAGWWWFLKSFANNYKYSLYTGLAVLFLGIIHPYDIVGWWVVTIGVYALILFKKEYEFRKIIKNILPSIISTGLVVIYFGFLLINEPALSGWHSQNITPSPGFFSLLTGYGFLWVFSIFGFLYILKNKTNIIYDWLVVWFLSLPLLLLAPISISRRLVSSFGIIIVIMSVIGLQYLFKKYSNKIFNNKKYTSILAIVALCLIISPLYQIIESVDELNIKRSAIYLNEDKRLVVDFLKMSNSDSLILAEPFTANSIPALTGRRVWLGHTDQTVNFYTKQKYLNRFYTMPWSGWHKEFVLKNNIDYIVWPADRITELSDDVYVQLQTDSILLLKIDL